MGGRIIHILPVNNLSGHGFWQFTSDLIYSIYSNENGFENTQVWYASAINFSEWRQIPNTQSGVRVEVVSMEPLILLVVTEKLRIVGSLNVMQPFYQQSVSENSTSALNADSGSQITTRLKNHFPASSGSLLKLLRNLWLLFGLATGRSRFSIKKFRKVRAER